MTKRKIKIDIYSIIIFAVSTAVLLILYKKMPEQIPMHFGSDGVKYWSKPASVGFYTLIMMVLTVVAQMPTYIAKNVTDNGKIKAMKFILHVSISLLPVLFYVSVAYALGYRMNNEFIPALLVALVMGLLGNRMPQLPRNRYVGLRLPWTVRDDRNWKLSHRLMGYMAIPLALAEFIGHFFIGMSKSVTITVGTWVAAGVAYSIYLAIENLIMQNKAKKEKKEQQ